jgi:HEPN domain-containing protein
MKTPDEVKGEYVRQWLEKADMDLKAAEYLLSASGFSDIICFHAQQAAEKLLKAVLAYKKVEIPKTHDLKLLLDLTGLTEEDMRLNEDEIDELSGYCVEARYPADLPVLDNQDAITAVKVVKKIHRSVLPILTLNYEGTNGI